MLRVLHIYIYMYIYIYVKREEGRGRGRGCCRGFRTWFAQALNPEPSTRTPNPTQRLQCSSFLG